ncbi:hypothetical protein [uncultured Pseudokineococcus sp.]|uniref:hypothetical protein n=1 Tax=uncultured Pseudokineococcus sp. TaxID=1642928 RepID=UPI002635345A|nr:hypothetical protein [uncultured Pseudokineococcus sp.]
MARADGDPASAPRRLALPLIAGATAWACAGYVYALPVAVAGDGAVRPWAQVLVWVVATAGAALALVCAYRLARRLEAHLLRPHRVPPAAPPAGVHRGWLRSPATVLVVVGASLGAVTEVVWVVSSVGLSSWVFGLTQLAGLAAPVALAAGAYLALRRLEDLLAGHHRARPPRRATEASGLTTPHVRTTGAGGAG